MKKALVLCLLLCSRLLAFAVPADILNLWNEANRAYQEKQYEHAIDNYQGILKSKFADAQVYYNLANAYYKNGQNGPALVNYMRTIQADPSFREAKQNIVFIQAQSNFKGIQAPGLPGTKWYHKLSDLFSPDAWAWLAAALAIITAILFLLKSRNKISHANRWLSLGAGMAILAFVFSIFAHQNNSFTNTAVVTVENGFLYDSQKKLNVKMNLGEGTIVKITNTSGALVEVVLDNGLKGWIDPAEIEKI